MAKTKIVRWIDTLKGLTVGDIMKGLSYPFRWIVGLDIPAYDDKDGIGLFSFYAGFIAGQQTILGVLANSQSDVAVACGWFLALTLATLTGIVIGLRNQQSGKHCFNKPSIHFGRWVFVVSAVVSLLFIWTAYRGKLPWQKPERVDFDQPIDVQVNFINDHVPSYTGPTDNDANMKRMNMNEWFRWIRDGIFSLEQPDSKEHRQLLWVEQDKPFERKYYSFDADVLYSKQYRLDKAIAFLVNGDYGARFTPVYQELDFELDKTDRDKQTSRFKVRLPNENDRLVLWLLIVSDDVVSNPNDYGIKINTLSIPASPTKEDHR